jgi:hypothetical protein
MSMRGKRAFAILLLCAIGLVPGAGRAATCVAYSLSRAQKELSATGSSNEDVRCLGGITRPLGIVYDQSTKELILVGQANEHEERLLLDDLVVAFRAVLKHDSVPAVSIDITPDTEQTGKQAVRFEGHIERTQLGRDLLAADVVLKKLGMGILSVGETVPSYLEMRATNWRETGLEDSVRSRFWFLPSKQSFVAVRDGVVVINRFELDVGVEVLSSRTIDSSDGPSSGQVPTDEIGTQFAQTLATRQQELCKKYPGLRRLESLFRFVGLAQGMARLQKKGTFSPNLSYWLSDYDVTKVETAIEYPLLVWAEFLRNDDKAVRMVVEGGIDLQTLLLELSDGDAQAFKEVVLLSKPEGDPLAWSVPLDGWPAIEVDDSQGSKEAGKRVDLPSHPLGRQLGTTLATRFEQAYAHDNMQLRLENITMMLPQQFHQPHALDLLQADNRWQNPFSQSDNASVQLASPSFAPVDSPTVLPQPYTTPQSFVPPMTFDVPEAISWMNQIEMPPPAFAGFQPRQNLLDSIEPLARQIGSPLDMAWNAIHEPIHQSLPIRDDPMAGMATPTAPLIPDNYTSFATPSHGYDPSNSFKGSTFTPAELSISSMPTIQETFQSYNNALSTQGRLLQPSDFGGGRTPDFSSPSIDLTPPGGFTPLMPSYSPPPSYTPYTPPATDW